MTRLDASKLPDWKTLLTAIVVPTVFFAAVELVLALFGVRPVLYEDDPYVGFAGSIPLFVEEPATGDMVTAANKLRFFNPQRFSSDKDAATFRIFCVGGSTTHGRPYGDSTSFCGWLRALLPVVDPSRDWEVVNAGGVSYASYRAALLMEELIAWEPDLFIVYSGHNEFLERRTYSGLIRTPAAVRGLSALLSRTRLWAFGRSLLERSSRGRDPAAEGAGAPQLAAEVTTLLDASVGPDAYERDDALRTRILEHYRFNLSRIVDIGRAGGAEVMLITPASNLRHSSPFKSQHRAGLQGAALEVWEDLMARAEVARDLGDSTTALRLLDEALEIDDRWAHLHFERGRALDRLGRRVDAATAFVRALEEDVCPLRALPAMATIVREVALDRAVPVVDFADRVETLAPDGLPGEELFLDHVHPRIELHRTLALDLLTSLRSAGILPREASWSDALVSAVSRRVEESLDPDAHGRALLNLSKVLGWAGKLEEAGRLAVLAASAAPAMAEAHYQAGLCAQLLGDLDTAVAYYRRALELAPRAATAHGNLAAALEANGSTLQAILHYRQAVELLGDEDTPYRRQLVETLRRLGATPEG